MAESGNQDLRFAAWRRIRMHERVRASEMPNAQWNLRHHATHHERRFPMNGYGKAVSSGALIACKIVQAAESISK